MTVWRSEHTATLITGGPHSGQVLVAGGSGFYPALATTSEFFNPAGAGTFSGGPSMSTPRFIHAAVTLLDGRIALVGGRTDWTSNQSATSSVEIYDPGTDQQAPRGDLIVDRDNFTVDVPVIGPNQGKLFAAGGNSMSALSSRTVEVFDPAVSTLAITLGSLPDGVVTQAYLGPLFTAIGGTGSGQLFSVVWGALPPGLGPMQSNGVIQGSPTAGGVFAFVVKVVDSGSNVAYRSFTIVVDRLLVASTSPLPNASTNVGYNFQFTTTGGSGAKTWSLEPGNTLPAGFSLSAAGLLSGSTPTASSYFFNVRVRDASGQTAVKGFSLLVQ